MREPRDQAKVADAGPRERDAEWDRQDLGQVLGHLAVGSNDAEEAQTGDVEGKDLEEGGEVQPKCCPFCCR